MQGMDPETGFPSEANKLFKGDPVVYIKGPRGGGKHRAARFCHS